MSELDFSMLDLRQLGDDYTADLEEIASRALFDPDPIAREFAIRELTERYPLIIGAYARNRIILYLRDNDDDAKIHQAYLCDLKEPFRTLKSHPFIELDGKD